MMKTNRLSILQWVCDQPPDGNGKWTIQHQETQLYLAPLNGLIESGNRVVGQTEPYNWDAWPLGSNDVTVNDNDYCR